MKLPAIFNVEKIVAFFERLSKREKIILMAAAAVLSILGAYHLVLRPIFGTFSSLSRQVVDLKTDIKKSVRLLSQKDQIMKEVQEYKDYSLSSKSPEEETVALLKFIEEMANKASINLLYVKPGGIKADEAGKRYFATLESEGPMPQLLTFFYDLETSNQLLRVEKYTLQPVTKGSSVVKCAATISRPTLG